MGSKGPQEEPGAELDGLTGSGFAGGDALTGGCGGKGGEVPEEGFAQAPTGFGGEDLDPTEEQGNQSVETKVHGRWVSCARDSGKRCALDGVHAMSLWGCVWGGDGRTN